jgi:hypothetical protein
MNLFERWCVLNGHKPFGASPETVARFVADIEPLGIGQVWKAVQAISRAHSAHGLPDPTLGGPVAAAINAVAKIDPPRSWPAEEKLRFLTLPYDIQSYLAKRQAADDSLIRKLQNELAQLKKGNTNDQTTDTAGTDRTGTDQAAA